MRVKEITVSLSGTIGTAPYENFKPSFSMTMELLEGDDENKAFNTAKDYLHNLFELEANRAKIDLIEKQYSNIKFREKDGKKYPSVTSILNWEKTWKIPEDELKQYSARGVVVHKLIELYLETKEWRNPLDIPALKEEVSILMSGSKGFSWEDCSHIAFMEKYRDKIEVKSIECEVFNSQQLYSGRYDIKGKYEGIPSIMDFKTGSDYDMRQLAAYAVCEEGIEQLVILPVGPTENKTGIKKPIVCDTIQDQFKDFIKARARFKERFGI